MLLLVVLVLGSRLLVSEGANLTAAMQLMGQTQAVWEGRFCFHVPDAVLGFELHLHFSAGVKQIVQHDLDWLGGTPSDCSQDLNLVNKEGHWMHSARLFCTKLSGVTCGPAGNLTAQGTLVDLTHTDMKVPEAPVFNGAAPMKYNYGEVLQKSLLFYEAQRSGHLPANNRIPWRRDSALHDLGHDGEDLTGGWYDAGDNIKYNFPMASTTTVLCWSLHEFQNAYDAAGQLDHMYDTIRWPLEYFLKCHTKPNELYVQVGSGVRDHHQWVAPEAMSASRTAYKVDADHPGSEVAMEMAAAMACGSIVFRTKDAKFSAQLLEGARGVYQFGKDHQGLYHNALPNEEVVYRSGSKEDENHWGAVWMYKATEEDRYLQDAKNQYDHSPGWAFSWDEKTAGNHILMAQVTEEQTYLQDVERYLNSWLPKGSLPYTPDCLAYRQRWGALRYAANTAFIALLAANQGLHAEQYRQWAMCQIHYALGDTGRSFVVGFGTNPPTHYHHRGSTCPLQPAPCGWSVFTGPQPNAHTLYGALVGGPDQRDVYSDIRSDYVQNEVSCDYNAGFQASAAALLQLALDDELPDPEQCGIC